MQPKPRAGFSVLDARERVILTSGRKGGDCHTCATGHLPTNGSAHLPADTCARMEKEEESTRELLLPNWQGSGSHGLTIAQRDDGVFVQEVMQNSPAARTGVVKEGDQIVGATIYFDNLQSGEVAQLLNTMGHHTVGLKLHRKGDRSPEPGQTWTHEVFSSHSSEVVL
ncbi:AHNAK nucleoprotein isoform 3, partial [Camelus ferus]